jgi:uncharacterized protein (TIGR00725 family)
MIQIGIIGSAGREEYPEKMKGLTNTYKIAKNLGELIAKRKAVLITGGKGGVMKSAAEGAKSKGGFTVGIVKGDSRNTANKYIDIEISANTSGEGEEDILVSSCDGIIVVGGGAGTLQELACAYRKKKPIVICSVVDGVGMKYANSYLDERRSTKIYAEKGAKEIVDKVFFLIRENRKKKC